MPRQFQSFLFALSLALVAFAPAARAEKTPASKTEKAPAAKDKAAAPKGDKAPKDDGRRPRPDVEGEMNADAELARATAFYEAGQYAQCADAFAGMLDDPDKVRALSPR